MRQYELSRAWDEWLRQWRWNWWVTLTFRFPVSQRQAHRIWKRWLHSLENKVKGKVHYVRATEVQRFRGAIPHYHALLIGVQDEQPREWESIWYRFGGLAKIELYNPELGATHYLAKGAENKTVDIIFSKHLERAQFVFSRRQECHSKMLEPDVSSVKPQWKVTRAIC